MQTETTHTERVGLLEILTVRVDDDGDTYYLAGIWDLNGRLLYDSAPETYDTQDAALAAARRELPSVIALA